MYKKGKSVAPVYIRQQLQGMYEKGKSVAPVYTYGNTLQGMYEKGKSATPVYIWQQLQGMYEKGMSVAPVYMQHLGLLYQRTINLELRHNLDYSPEMIASKE